MGVAGEETALDADDPLAELHVVADLSAAGFDVEAVSQQSTDYEPGTVSAQSPDGGKFKKEGATVTIYIAEEPEPTETTTAPSPSQTESVPASPTESDDTDFPFGWSENSDRRATHWPHP